MKKLVLLMAAMVFGMGTHAATTSKTTTATYRYGNSFIFNESGVTFSVYPDGEFDFFIDNRLNIGVGARVGNVGITFNSGWDYNPFVQYDDFGAVIQVENVPIFYDYYGRVSQIGDIDIWYRNGYVRRLGGLDIFWNGGRFSHTTGYINIYNRAYVYRPYHRWFARPAVNFCNVYTTPYRRYYSPVRYSWYTPYRNNVRRSYVQLGRTYRYNNTRRSNIYRNDRRVAVKNYHSSRRTNSYSNNSAYAQNRSQHRSYQSNSRSNRSISSRSQGTTTRNYTPRTTSRSSTAVNRSNRGNTGVNSTTRSTTVNKRSVRQSPSSNSVAKRSSNYARPRSVSPSRSNSSNRISRSSAPKRTVSRGATGKRPSVATSRSSRSTNSRSTNSRSRSVNTRKR